LTRDGSVSPVSNMVNPFYLKREVPSTLFSCGFDL